MTFKEFVISMFKVGFIGFGGGSALIPVIDSAVVRKMGDGDNYCKDIVIASVTPGALPVELSSGIGRRYFGRWGMLFGALAMALPGVLLSLVLYSCFYFIPNESFEGRFALFFRVVSIIVTAYILYLLTKYIISAVFKSFSLIERFWRVAVMSVVAIPVCMKWISTIAVLSLFFVIAFFGSLFVLRHKKRVILRFRPDTGRMAGDILVWVSFFTLFFVSAVLISAGNVGLMEKMVPFSINALLSSFVSFGGGDAYLSIADGFFVQTGWILDSDFYGRIVPIVNMLPGSILCKTLTGVGFYMVIGSGGSYATGLGFAALGFACSVAGSCLSFGIAGYLYDSFSESSFVEIVNRWIRPVICGLLIGVMFSLVKNIF